MHEAVKLGTLGSSFLDRIADHIVRHWEATASAPPMAASPTHP